MKRLLFSCLGILACAHFVSCVWHEYGGGGSDQGQSSMDAAVDAPRPYDILFVIDNSRSMNEEQEALRTHFPAFVEILAGKSELLDIHIAVVSSDVGIGHNTSPGCVGKGDDGDFLRGKSDSCDSITTNTGYLVDTPRAGGERDRNYTGSLGNAFSCIANIGDDGCGFEQHLEGMKRSLSKAQLSIGRNAGFLRDNANLAIIIIADEDDCSATLLGADTLFDTTQDSESSDLGFFSSFRCWEYGVECSHDDPSPRTMDPDGGISPRHECVPRDNSPYMAKVSDFVHFVNSLKADPRRVFVAGIIGDPQPVRVQRRNIDQDSALEMNLMPSCASPKTGEAAPATRIAAFLSAFGDRSVQKSICPANGNLGGALTQIAERLVSM